jgi:flagellum-specific ATP synthase
MSKISKKLERYTQELKKLDVIKVNGRVTQVVGLLVESLGPTTFVGEACLIKPRGNRVNVACEVVGFRENKVLLMPLGDLGGIGPGCEVVATGDFLKIPVDKRLLGRVVDSLGQPIDGRFTIHNPENYYTVENDPPNPMTRPRIESVLVTGVRAIDALMTLGTGQRVGVFAGSGVGKSTLMGMIARNSCADINVISLIGERGREVREFIEKDLGEEGLRRSVVVVETSDKPALLRLKGAMTATTIAEYFRDQGNNVMLMMDSVTRYARAQREIGLAVGEPPAQRGFPPSTYAVLPRLLERAGTSPKGSITGLYTVLVEADDMDEPIADTVRGILDGHIVLSRVLAHRNHFPAIDILQSISRLINDLSSDEHGELIAEFRNLLAVYEESRDLINIGAYVRGSNPSLDRAIHYIGKMEEFLRQPVDQSSTMEKTLAMMKKIFAEGN